MVTPVTIKILTNDIIILTQPYLYFFMSDVDSLTINAPRSARHRAERNGSTGEITQDWFKIAGAMLDPSEIPFPSPKADISLKFQGNSKNFARL